jgi:hypothetical protein
MAESCIYEYGNIMDVHLQATGRASKTGTSAGFHTGLQPFFASLRQ